MSENYIARNEAEKALLGIILLEAEYRQSRECINQAHKSIKATDFQDQFFESLHPRIYQAMIDTEYPPTRIAVAQELLCTEKLRKGDCAYMTQLIADCPSTLDAEYYTKIVSDYSVNKQKRKILKPIK